MDQIEGLRGQSAQQLGCDLRCDCNGLQRHLFNRVNGTNQLLCLHIKIESATQHFMPAQQYSQCAREYMHLQISCQMQHCRCVVKTRRARELFGEP